MTAISVNTYTYTSAYLSGNLVRSVSEIVRRCGLDLAALTNVPILERGLKRWIETRDLVGLTLEIFNPRTDALVGRFDFDIDYGYATEDDGGFWFDKDQVTIAVYKAGLRASQCSYRVVATTKAGRPEVDGWGPATLRSTDGFARYAVGSAIGAGASAAGLSYYSRS